MTSYDDFLFLPLKVIRTGPSGKRTYDPEGKRRLIEACLRPGVSISGLALRAGINANQLRKWVCRSRKRAPLPSVRRAVKPASPAFLPVVEIGAATLEAPKAHAPAHPLPRPASPARLSARLPNGVAVELECTADDAALVTAMIAALGAR